MTQIDVGGLPLEYVEQGAGDPVVLVHGVLCDLRVWRNQMDILSRGHRVIAYSRRNHYPNPWSEYPKSYSLALEREDLVGLIKGLGLGPVHLVGNSLGAAIAALVARDNPEVVRTLVLNDPALRAIISSDPGAGAINELASRVARSTKERINAGDLEGGAKIWTDFLRGEGAFEKLSSAVQVVVVQNTRPLLAELTDTPEPFACEDAKRISMPTLVMSGDPSPPPFQRIDERIAECIPHAESEAVPFASHAPFMQNPAFFNLAVLKFISRR